MIPSIDERSGELGGLIPQFAAFTDRLLYAEVWERAGLSRRDRSLITIAALVAMYRPDQIRSHMQFGLANGITPEEMGEMLTHLAFYASWPSANSAAYVFKAVMEEGDAASPTNPGSP